MMNFTLKSALMAASALVFLGTPPAQASADAVRAEAYFNAISGGNAETIASFYADDAEFHWIGGPLDGKYKGKTKIKGVWEKFSQAAGKIDHEVLELSESANGKTSTVTARVMFKADSEVPVKFIMVYKDGKIASEVWQVDRSDGVEAKAEETPAPAAAGDTGNQPQREAANVSASNTTAPEAAAPAQTPEAQNAPEAQAAAPTPAAAPAAVEQPAVPAPQKTLKPAAQPKAKYAEEKRGYGYEKKTYKPRRRHYGHDRYYDHGHGGYYGRYGGYDQGHGDYGPGYGHY